MRLVSGRAFAGGIDVPRRPFFLARRAAWRARRSCRGDPTIRAKRRAGGFADDKDAARFSGRSKDGRATGTSPHCARMCVYASARVCAFGVYARGWTVGGGAIGEEAAAAVSARTHESGT